MKIALIMNVLVVILLLFQGIQSAPWSPSCPHECWCHDSYLSSIVDGWHPLNQTQQDAANLSNSTSNDDILFRAAICVQQHDTEIKTLLDRLPSQAEAMKIIQASDAPEIRLTLNHLTKFINLRALSLEGAESNDISSSPNIILHSDSLRPLTQLQYLSLVNLELLDDPSPDEVTLFLMADREEPSATPQITYHNVPKQEEAILPYEEFKKQQLESQNEPWNGFSMLKNLEYLLIVGCQLPEAFSRGHSGAFTSLRHLKELTIRSSQMRVRLEMEPGDLMEIESLSLADNELLEIEPGDLQGMGALHNLDLSGNQLTHLTENSFPFLPDLEWLDLSANPLRVIYPNTFSNISSIRRLLLGSFRWRDEGITEEPIDGIEVVSVEFGPDSFNGLVKLQELWISQGHPEGNKGLHPNYFKDLSSLSELHIRGRLISIEADAFAANRRLQNLDLRKCQIRRLSVDAFQSLRKLRSLDLSFNELTQLPPGVFDPVSSSLKELWLNGNRLTGVPADIFSALTTTTKLIRLEGNPWHCTCQLNQLRATAVNKIKIWDALANRTGYQYDRKVAPLCASPKALKGAALFDVMQKPLRCNKIDRLASGRIDKTAAYGDDIWNEPQLIEEDETVDHGAEAADDQQHSESLAGKVSSMLQLDQADIIDHGEEVVESTTRLSFETPSVLSKQVNDVLSVSSNNYPQGLGPFFQKNAPSVTLSKKSIKLRMEQEMKNLVKKKYLPNL
ncbi:insulin-like growth factor-binding protein complex acid labile subunit [Daphnia carinata]|uniref:insulin-like growth factor-binding protein complex acid labile subunit n=1 Tax=Daphnia carinata TaxID=120202 RepID=UPI00257CAACC|nr:insulin-like growth factor-binding protein complex acid labile subunit [Daphnia carinata]